MGRNCKGKTPGPCKHCGRRLAWQSRGLCNSCYEKPAVREQYPLEAPTGNRGSGIGLFRELGRPELPTAAPPGSPEKLAVLEERARRGLALHHDDDLNEGACKKGGVGLCR